MNRLTFDVNDDFDKTLDELVKDSNQSSDTKADVVRRAVATYKYLKDQETKEGKKIAITDQSGAVTQKVELP